MNNKILPVVTLIVGFLIGKNWNKIEKFLKPYLEKAGVNSNEVYSGIMTFLLQQKEKVEDVMAESKIKTKKENTTEEKKEDKVKKEKIESSETLTDVSKETTAKTSPQFLKIRIQQIIKEHPEGILLKKMAEIVGVHFASLIHLVKELLEKNKIRKEEKLYFPIR